MSNEAATSARILVIDDDKAIRGLVELHLVNEGYEVVQAEDAVVGARLMLTQQIDVIVLDAHLPYWSGLEFAATLIADRDVVCPPIIMMTGHDHLSDRAALMADACLKKPFLSTDLIAAVSQCLRHRGAYAGVRANTASRAA